MNAKLLKSLLLMVGAASATASFAQEAREFKPMLTDGKAWRVEVITAAPELPSLEYREEYYMAVCGDTIVQGKDCKVIESYRVDAPAEKNRFVGYENDGVVYNVCVPGQVSCQPQENVCFQPLMSFGYNVGDRIAHYNYMDGSFKRDGEQVSEVNTKEVDGQTVREIVYSDLVIPEDGNPHQRSYKVCWVEGVGANYSTSYTWMTEYPLTDIRPSKTVSLIECTQDGKVIFTANDFSHKFEMAQEAREFKPMLTDGKSWLMMENQSYQGRSLGVRYMLEVKGDTVVDGLTCKRIERYNVGSEMERTDFALYEAEGKVYRIHEQQGAEPALELIADFGLKPGDTYTIKSDISDLELTVIEENTVTVGGVDYREMVVGITSDDSDASPMRGSWVEGIGLSRRQNSLMYVEAVPISGLVAIDDAMLACYQDGKLLFGREDFTMPGALPEDEFHQMLTDGRAWRVGVMHRNTLVDEPSGIYEYMMEVKGDTVVNGRDCKVIESRRLDAPTKTYRFVGYEDNGRVFNVCIHGEVGAQPFHAEIETVDGVCFQPLMDFTLSGCTAVAEYDYKDGSFDGYCEKSASCHLVEVNGERAREIVISGGMMLNGHEDTQVCWVEGIGANYATYDSWLTNYPLYANGNNKSYSYLIECTQDGKVIFSAKDFISPFEMASISEVSAAKPAADGAVYDLQGRRVATPAPGHIYIQNGKKIKN